MKTQEVRRFSFPSIGPCSVFTFHKSSSTRFGDLVYVGCENGRVLYSSTSTSSAAVQLSTSTSCHRGKVSSIHISYNPKVVHRQQTSPLGILFSGGRDHCIKVWNPLQGTKSLIQTLVGHEGIVTSIVEGSDGSIISCSSDGTLKVWTAVAGRNDFLNPYYECSFTYISPTHAWFTCVCSVDMGPWICYLADSTGNITSFRKSTASINDNTIAKYQFFEKVHSLSITSMILVKEDDLLVTASSDTFCKLIDSKSGNCLMTIRNNRQGRYEGISWIRFENRLYLTDEFGFLDIFSLQKMSILSTHHLYRQSEGEKFCTVSSHKFSILGSIVRAKDDHHFVVLLPYSSALSKQAAYNGDIALWRLQVDQSVAHFQGHSESIVSVARPHSCKRQFSDKFDQLSKRKSFRNTAEFSNEETCIVTVSADQTIRCWDEYNCQESFQIRIPDSLGSVMCSLTIWEMNSIITCHDYGHICIWDICSGSMISCKVFQDSIQSLTLGSYNNHFGVIAADLSGSIGFISLTQFDKNPTVVPISKCRKGFHDDHDPGILAITYNRLHDLIFSGGNDRSIRYWKPSSTQCNTISRHNDGVCLLQNCNKFLLSGDISGMLILWELTNEDDHVDIEEVCRWSVNGIPSFSSCSTCQLIESSTELIFVVQTTLVDTITIWSVSSGSKIEQTNLRGSDVGYERLSDKISVSRYAEINLEDVEITTTQVSCRGDGCVDDERFLPQYVYCGTTEGSVLRYEVDAYLL
jgi:WD40 repeat protein